MIDFNHITVHILFYKPLHGGVGQIENVFVMTIVRCVPKMQRHSEKYNNLTLNVFAIVGKNMLTTTFDLNRFLTMLANGREDKAKNRTLLKVLTFQSY